MKAKKSLGQNFLKSPAVIRKMISVSDAGEGDLVLEIGPGKGALTKHLLGGGARVIAVEKDGRMIPFLEEMFKAELASGQLRLVHADILEANLHEIGIEKNTPYKLIANIPYYITGQIIESFLSFDHQPISITIMVQKEVARRVVASDKKESILSISVKIYGEPHYIQTVSKKLFSPSPKVDSAILHIDNISKNNFKNVSEEDFFKIVKAGFAHKRKMIGGNLKKYISSEKLTLSKIEPTQRPETLSAQNWLTLATN